ncbi:Kelch domain-containing protein 2-like [Aphelenchoides bicaudatus]|nr:Kelch domain-containing protein 2-like [Aphelenchoides bicaudatus]
MNNFLSIFDNNQHSDDDLMFPRVSFELTENLTPVAGHVATSYRGCLLVFAGYFCSENQLGYREPEFLYVYPYALAGNFNVWLKIKCTSKVPLKPNCGASALIHGDSLFIFGGTTTVPENIARSRSFSASTLYKLDLKTGVWQFVDIPLDKKLPTPRDKSASWIIGNKLYFFGGYGARLSRLEHTDSYLFDADDFKEGNDAGRNVWNNQLLEFDVVKSEWNLVPKSGCVPTQRAAPGAAYVQDLHSVFLFGGRDEACRLNDLYRLDNFSMHWSKLEVEGEKPSGRSWSTFTLLPKQRVILMQGGFSNEDQPLDDAWHLDLSDFYDLQKCRDGTATVRWICIRPPTAPPEPNNEESNESEEDVNPYRRFWHTANLMSEAVLVYGGMNQNPTISGPCLNSLHIQQHQPTTLFKICLRSLQRNHLHELPSIFSTFNLKRKLNLLEEMHRFKNRKSSSSYLTDSTRHCPSLFELSLSEIFDVLDLKVN